MSKAAIQRTVKFIGKSGTYTAYLSSQYGSVWQMYDEVWNCVPDWSRNNVTVYFTVVSSLVANGQQASIQQSPIWKIGGQQINNGTTVVQGWADAFEIIAPSQGNQYWGLKIKANLAQRFSGSSTNLYAVGELVVGDKTTSVHAETPISFTPATEGGVKIIVKDVSTPVSKNFTFNVDNENIILKCETYQGLAQLDDTAQHITDNGVSYQWQKIVNAAWTNITGATQQQLTVNERDIMTYGQYRCRVTYASNTFYGTADLMDSTDPYIINPGAKLMTTDNPPVLIEDGCETIEDPNTQVMYSPKIVLRGSDTVPAGFSNAKFDFAFGDSAGAIFHSSTNQASDAVTYDMCLNHGNVAVSIESHDELSE